MGDGAQMRVAISPGVRSTLHAVVPTMISLPAGSVWISTEIAKGHPRYEYIARYGSVASVRSIPDDKVSRVYRDPESGVIRCVYVKSESLEVLAGLLAKAFKIAEETGETRWLFDARALPNTAPTLGIFERSEFVAKMALGKGVRVAALFNEKVPLENARFMETVARNRGLEVTLHSDEESALRWLGPRADRA